jgi:type II secretory pathway component PulC
MKGLSTMKQDLWLANSSLVVMFALFLATYELLQQEAPPWHAPKVLATPETEKKKETPAMAPSWEKIYQDDIFGTYIPSEIKATKKSLITPIPEPQMPTIPPPPEPKKQEFVPPLNITLRGIIAGGEESKNVAMITDETNKEGMYHLGEKIKDAQIIKIAYNRIVLLRANGQQEIFYLRKDDALMEQNTPDRWKFIVRKIDDQNYEIDPAEFTREIDSLGYLIDQASVIGAAYHEGKPVGMRLGKIEPDTAGSALGLMENDIITTVNNLSTSNAKDRLEAFDVVTNLGLGNSVTLGIKRADKDITLSYKLARIGRPRKLIFPGVTTVADGAQPAAPGAAPEPFKLSRLQQREKTMRDFDKMHPNDEQRQQTWTDIRKRILENLQHRFQH